MFDYNNFLGEILYNKMNENGSVDQSHISAFIDNSDLDKNNSISIKL